MSLRWVVLLATEVMVDFFRTGQWDTYQTVIAGILGYMLIFGKKDLARVDGWGARRVERWQSRRNQAKR